VYVGNHRRLRYGGDIMCIRAGPNVASSNITQATVEGQEENRRQEENGNIDRFQEDQRTGFVAKRTF